MLHQSSLEMVHFFMMRVIKDWHRLSRGVVDAPSLEVLKARLNEAWKNLV